MRVVYFVRRPRRGANFSVELIVDGVMTTLDPAFDAVRAVCRFESNGVLRRIYNATEAAFRQGEVNHIVGDVHFLAVLLDPRKTILTVLDCGRIAGASDFKTQIVKLIWYTVPVRICTAVTVISHSVKDELLRHVPIDPAKVHVVPVAVPGVYARAPKEFNASCPVILQIGTAPNKNLMRLIQALDGIPCQLRIIGNLRDEVVTLLREHRIEYENHVGLTNEQMLEQYVESDIVAFASTFEGFGMPIIEANIVGRPVVTGNVASMPEVAGRAACLVDPFDVAAIRQGILRIIDDADYRDELVRNGYENAARYEQSEITRLYESLYREVNRRNREREWSRSSSRVFRASLVDIFSRIWSRARQTLKFSE